MRERKPEFNRRDFLGASLKMGAATAVALGVRIPRGFELAAEADRDFFDVLDTPTQKALAQKASTLIRPTPVGTIELADWLRGSTQSSGNNICGPLALYQLIDTVTYGVKPNDLWLGNIRLRDPVGGSDPFSRAFPADRFDCFETNTPILDFDFREMDLQPGDFIYFKGGNGKGDDHMMTIATRDERGTLWAITNYPDKDKQYIIKSVPFYNPKNPKGGFIKELGEGNNPVRFSSGQGGFVLYRLKEGQPSAYNLLDHAPEAERLRTKLKEILGTSRGKWRFIVTNLDSGMIVAENFSNADRVSASVIKVPIALCVMSVIEKNVKTQSELPGFLKNTKYKGVTFDESLTKMLRDSNEQATGRMVEYLESQRINSQNLLKSWGINNTRPESESRVSTEQDILRVFRTLYDLNDTSILKYPYSHQYLLDAMKVVSTQDPAGLGRLPSYGVKAENIYNKIGIISRGVGSVVATAGIVELPSKAMIVPTPEPYFISINGQEAEYSTLLDEFYSLLDTLSGYLREVN